MSMPVRAAAALSAYTAGRLPVIPILGVQVTDATKREAITLFEHWIATRPARTRAVFIVNAHTLNLACDDPAYRAVLNAADVVFADGTGVRLAARLKGVQLRDNLVGTDLLPAFFRAKLECHYRYFVLGGAPGTAERAAAHLRREFPGITIAGHHHGYFGQREAPEVVRRINASAPDLLLVGMGNPIQEQWIQRHRAALRVPISVGVGGLFDHWAGRLQRAPRWVRDLGMEWAQILMQQPHKWRRYVLGNPKFVARALLDARRDGAPPLIAPPPKTDPARQDQPMPRRPGGATAAEQWTHN
ncbi:MAG: WecB/TagA/CpsF family glycosyltransferase [Deltaproteobacteria bacterium]|nr:WecB/TagA/CpsF family glycosyltransferase [Deltaproteobacteria bacterium]